MAPLPVVLLTLRKRTVFISLKNAAILSDGTLTVGWPDLRVRPAMLLMGASTGGTVGFRLARTEARNELACRGPPGRPIEDMRGPVEKGLDIGGGGGGGGGGI